MSSSSPRATVLGLGARIEGDLCLEQNAILQGEITGHVYCEAHLELAEDAVVHGDVRAASLALAGRVHGRVVVRQTTELLPTGTVEGDLHTGHLVVAEGATYQGQLKLTHPTETDATTDNTPHPFSLNRSAMPRQQVDLAEVAQQEADTAEFHAIPGTVNAGLRPRRRRPESAAS